MVLWQGLVVVQAVGQVRIVPHLGLQLLQGRILLSWVAVAMEGQPAEQMGRMVPRLAFRPSHPMVAVVVLGGRPVQTAHTTAVPMEMRLAVEQHPTGPVEQAGRMETQVVRLLQAVLAMAAEAAAEVVLLVALEPTPLVVMAGQRQRLQLPGRQYLAAAEGVAESMTAEREVTVRVVAERVAIPETSLRQQLQTQVPEGEGPAVLSLELVPLAGLA